MQAKRSAAPQLGILILPAEDGRGWRATAILPLEQTHLSGPSTTEPARTPVAALDQLLVARFAILSDTECPATIVAIDPISEGVL